MNESASDKNLQAEQVFNQLDVLFKNMVSGVKGGKPVLLSIFTCEMHTSTNTEG